jgi:hypothetical protein
MKETQNAQDILTETAPTLGLPLEGDLAVDHLPQEDTKCIHLQAHWGTLEDLSWAGAEWCMTNGTSKAEPHQTVTLGDLCHDRGSTGA